MVIIFAFSNGALAKLPYLKWLSFGYFSVKLAQSWIRAHFRTVEMRVKRRIHDMWPFHELFMNCDPCFAYLVHACRTSYSAQCAVL